MPSWNASPNCERQLSGVSALQPAAAAPTTDPTTLADGIAALPQAAEDRTGYERTKFKHWIDADHDRCTTRSEVLIAESRTAPTIEGTCTVTAGEWFSYYDGKTLTDPKGLDIDHMVPLAEAWDSGASQWSAKHREAYANDLYADRSLIAVTAKTNRSKADQDPAQWLPPAANAHCTYAADWVSTKLRWKLTADKAETETLNEIAANCPTTPIDAAAADAPADTDHA
ncbi:HNH endonuclease family protein [Streptomyces sp. NPDC058268]|uniref:HNH endonuclease family protein n=1 Tax=Streptomyces sp. NPDC058268 TaxID=3346413 RepID=UPI0036EB702A